MRTALRGAIRVLRFGGDFLLRHSSWCLAGAESFLPPHDEGAKPREQPENQVGPDGGSQAAFEQVRPIQWRIGGGVLGGVGNGPKQEGAERAREPEHQTGQEIRESEAGDVRQELREQAAGGAGGRRDRRLGDGWRGGGGRWRAAGCRFGHGSEGGLARWGNCTRNICPGNFRLF